MVPRRPLGPEGYTLTVEHDRIVAKPGCRGAFRAWTTLRQLMPAVCEQGCPKGLSFLRWRSKTRVPRPCRGLLLDCCRHFMAPSFVKDMIDVLAIRERAVGA